MYKQTFSQSYVIGEGIEAGHFDAVSIGSRKIIIIKKNANEAKLDRLTADVSQADSISRRIEAHTNEIYRLAGLHHPDAVEKGDRASGRALTIRFNDVALMAASLADSAEAAENTVMKLYRTAYGDETVVDSKYPDSDEFDSDTFAEELKTTLDMIGSGLPKVVRSEQVRNFAHRYYPDFTAEQLQELETELQAEQSLNSTPKNSP